MLLLNTQNPLTHTQNHSHHLKRFLFELSNDVIFGSFFKIHYLSLGIITRSVLPQITKTFKQTKWRNRGNRLQIKAHVKKIFCMKLITFISIAVSWNQRVIFSHSPTLDGHVEPVYWQGVETTVRGNFGKVIWKWPHKLMVYITINTVSSREDGLQIQFKLTHYLIIYSEMWWRSCQRANICLCHHHHHHHQLLPHHYLEFSSCGQYRPPQAGVPKHLVCQRCSEHGNRFELNLLTFCTQCLQCHWLANNSFRFP